MSYSATLGVAFPCFSFYYTYFLSTGLLILSTNLKCKQKLTTNFQIAFCTSMFLLTPSTNILSFQLHLCLCSLMRTHACSLSKTLFTHLHSSHFQHMLAHNMWMRKLISSGEHQSKPQDGRQPTMHRKCHQQDVPGKNPTAAVFDPRLPLLCLLPSIASKASRQKC